MDTLGSRAVGSTLDLSVDGSSRTFLIVQQGNPDPDLYDASCDGTWLLLDDLYTTRSWGSSGNYPATALHSWLNETFLASLDTTVQSIIQTATLPYWDRSAGAFKTGANGFQAKVFLLSGSEIGWEAAKLDEQDLGVALAYFEGSGSASAPIRVAYLGSSAKPWWTRDPDAAASNKSWYVMDNGNGTVASGSNSYGIRPAIILPSGTLIDEDGTLVPNAAPTITSTAGASGVDLGNKSAPFSLPYIVTDADGDPLTVTEQVDGITTRSYSPTSGALCGFEAVSDSTQFATIGVGPHTLTIQASDGVETATWTATFTKVATSASLTLTSPILTEGQILSAVIQVEGSIPTDADYSVELTNNALDAEPVWQDATEASRTGSRVTFLNQTATAGWAFNYRIAVERGASGTGGYISAVSGTVRSVVED